VRYARSFGRRCPRCQGVIWLPVPPPGVSYDSGGYHAHECGQVLRLPQSIGMGGGGLDELWRQFNGLPVRSYDFPSPGGGDGFTGTEPFAQVPWRDERFARFVNATRARAKDVRRGGWFAEEREAQEALEDAAEEQYARAMSAAEDFRPFPEGGTNDREA
jgi:hypothetical protein